MTAYAVLPKQRLHILRKINLRWSLTRQSAG
jgi:hypothetical protein